MHASKTAIRFTQRVWGLVQQEQVREGETGAYCCTVTQVLLFGQMQLSQASPRLCLAVLDGQPRLPPSELLSVLSWSLAAHLVKLAIGPLAAACPGDVLLMLATLKQLQELKLQVRAKPLRLGDDCMMLKVLSVLFQSAIVAGCSCSCPAALLSEHLSIPAPDLLQYASCHMLHIWPLRWPHNPAARSTCSPHLHTLPCTQLPCSNLPLYDAVQLVAPLDTHSIGTLDLLSLPLNTCTYKRLPCSNVLLPLAVQLVAPLDTHSSGTLDLLALTPLRRLTCLELLASSRLYVPLNVKVISLASLAWPQLAALRLSLAGEWQAGGICDVMQWTAVL